MPLFSKVFFRISALSARWGVIGLLMGLPAAAEAQIVGILGHLPGVEAIDYVSKVQAWVSTRTRPEQGAAQAECSLIYFEIPESSGDMGAPLSFVGRKEGVQIRALNSKWPILPDQTGRLTLRIKGQQYRYKMLSDENGVVAGTLTGTELKEVFKALAARGEETSPAVMLTYAEENAAKDARYAGTSNGAINNIDTDPRSRMLEARQKRYNRRATHMSYVSFPVSVRHIGKVIESFNACMKEISPDKGAKTAP